MRVYERPIKSYLYYTVAVWSERSQCWKAGKRAYESEPLAVRAAAAPGRYRVSRITENGRIDLSPFEIGGGGV